MREPSLTLAQQNQEVAQMFALCAHFLGFSSTGNVHCSLLILGKLFYLYGNVV